MTAKIELTRQEMNILRNGLLAALSYTKQSKGSPEAIKMYEQMFDKLDEEFNVHFE